MNEATIPAWSLLPSLGFRPDSAVHFSDILPGLSLDFGNFKLSAAALISPYSGEIVSFSGVLAHDDALRNIRAPIVLGLFGVVLENGFDLAPHLQLLIHGAASD